MNIQQIINPENKQQNLEDALIELYLNTKIRSSEDVNPSTGAQFWSENLNEGKSETIGIRSIPYSWLH